MSQILMCPPPDDELWPTLGFFVADWIEDNLCHGPGDLLGQAITLNDEERGWLAKMYEVEPPFLESRKRQVITRTPNPRAGRRRFQRCALSLRKGSCKTERAAWITACELHPEGPVRCAGFDGLTPIPKSVSDPYIPMISYSEEQTEELAYGALRRILQECPIGNDFDIGLERIIRLSGDGKAEAVSASPNARDGARTTFQHADETHRFVLDSLKRAWSVMLANLAKRPLADPWALETTTAPEPGAGSVAESTMEYAKQVLEGRASGRLFFYHRQASDTIDISTRKDLRTAVIDASGPYIAEWSDIDRIVDTFLEPDADLPYLERVWLNRLVQASGRAFDIDRWRSLEQDFAVPEGSAITLGFSGPRDSGTAIIATHLESGHQWPLGIWEKPPTQRNWEAPADEVDAAVRSAFVKYHVCRMYCNPPQWEGEISNWAGEFDKKRVVLWRIQHRLKAMGFAVTSFSSALTAGDLSHNGDKRMDAQFGAARQSPTGFTEDDKPLYILKMERPDSVIRVDAPNAAVLSWEARKDAVTAGEGVVPKYELLFVG